MNPTKALEWLSRGVAVFPVKLDKTPALSSWKMYQAVLPTEKQVRNWVRLSPSYAVVTGWMGLVVIDFDDLALYLSWREEHPAEAQTYSVTTGRGVHAYFFTQSTVRGSHQPGIDIKSAGGYVIGEGSQHMSGATYQALNENAPILCVSSLPLLLSNRSGERPIPGGLLSSEHTSAPRDTWAALDDPPAELGYDPLGRVKARFTALDFLTDEVFPTGPGWGLTCCPIHDDARPSLVVNLGGDHNQAHYGHVKCMAGCNGGRWMDVIRLYALLNGISDRQAVRELAERTAK